MDFFQQKNIEFYDFLNDTFGIRKARNWSDISQNITKAKISATYKFFSRLYPLNVDYSEKMKSGSSNFRSLHYNRLNPNNIIDEVVRYTLYSDEIYVFHPIQNPSVTNQRINPIRNPKYWLHDFMNSLYFYIVLQKWVRLGIVKLVINPYHYDLLLRDELDAKAKKRVDSFISNPDFMQNAEREVLETLAENLVFDYKGMDVARIKESLVNMETPKFPESVADELAHLIFAKHNKINPLYDKLNIPLETGLLVSKGGGNLESILYVTELLNSNLYTTDKGNWFQICQLENVNYWTKVAHLYSKIEMPFLDNVDTSFVLNLREDDRLSGVRSELGKIYNTVNSIPASEMNEYKLKELNGRFMEELKKADAEWESVRRGWYYGDETFRRILVQRLKKLPGKRESYSGEPVRTHDEQEAENLLKRALAHFGVTLAQMQSRKYNDVEKCLIVWLIRRRTAVPNQWICQKLNMGRLDCFSRYPRLIEMNQDQQVLKKRKQLDEITRIRD